VIVSWSIGGLLNELTARGEHPTVISFDENGVAYLLSAADDCSASYRKNQDLMRHPKARICRQTIYLWRPQ